MSEQLKEQRLGMSLLEIRAEAFTVIGSYFRRVFLSGEFASKVVVLAEGMMGRDSDLKTKIADAMLWSDETREAEELDRKSLPAMLDLLLADYTEVVRMQGVLGRNLKDERDAHQTTKDSWRLDADRLSKITTFKSESEKWKTAYERLASNNEWLLSILEEQKALTLKIAERVHGQAEIIAANAVALPKQ